MIMVSVFELSVIAGILQYLNTSFEYHIFQYSNTTKANTLQHCTVGGKWSSSGNAET